MKEEYLSIDTITRLVELEKENKELQDRMDKAIEYIENNDLYTQDIDYDYEENMHLLPPNDELERKELLEILRGEDNEFEESDRT